MIVDDPVALAGQLVTTLESAGIDAVGFTDTAPFTPTRRTLDARKTSGHHGGMAFTFRNPVRSTDPTRLLRNARTLVVGVLGYREDRPAPEGPLSAEVAAYAWRDYYGDLRAALERGAQVLREAGHRAVVVVDQNTMVDRAAAHRSGIAWWGRNSNLLIPGLGSWFVIGSIVTDAELPSGTAAVEDGCRSCTRCVDACPTDAIVDDGVIDARRCLAWLLQRGGMFPRAYRAALGARIYGCDDCQDSCPPGHPRRVTIRPRTDRSGSPQAWVEVLDLLQMSGDDLIDRFGRWYIPDRDPRYLRRNALVVLGNIGDGDDDDVVQALERWLSDDDELLRAHAVWAAARLGRTDLLETVRGDVSALVRSELALVSFVERSDRGRRSGRRAPESVRAAASATGASDPESGGPSR